MIDVFGRRFTTIGRRALRVRRHRCQTMMLGSSYGGYAICPDRIGELSVVYSLGVGLDVSFDEELIARLGVTVHAFDPTPASIAWLKSRPTPERFHFHPWGVADFDGTAAFHAPGDPEHVSHTMLSGKNPAPTMIEVPVLRLSTIMERLGHDHVDVLKMDIEGAEYPVLKDVLVSRIPVGQILIEFHHHRHGVPFAATQQAIDDLERAGYAVFHGDPRGYEFSFIRPDADL
jgi:FkbM family methyltransferase